MALEDVEQHVAAAPVGRGQLGVVGVRHAQAPTTPASCSGAAAPTVRKSCTLRIAPVSDGGEIVQPTRQPVTL